MTNLFRIDRPRLSGESLRVRIWRTVFHLNRMPLRRWRVGVSMDSDGVAIHLVCLMIVIAWWVHRDECQCDRCIPF